MRLLRSGQQTKQRMPDKSKLAQAADAQNAVEIPGAPVVTVPRPTTWVYVQLTGRLYRPDGTWAGTGYSGKGAGLNNPAMDSVRDVGPLPVGFYEFGEVNTEKGPLTIRLNPAPTNEMHSRAGFLVHGDNHLMNHTASEGCIIMPNPQRQEIAEAKGQTLKVIDRPAPVEIVT